MIHAHNDYENPLPFWNAYANGANSIEVDVILKNDTLYVAHEETSIKSNRTIERLYLKPLTEALNLELGSLQKLQLLIDIKTEAVSTLNQIVETLKKHPQLIENKSISFVISGNRPQPQDYLKYPEFIQFDYQSLEPISDPKIWDKIALISLPFKRYSVWNGKGRFTEDNLIKVKKAIAKAHSYHKPFRFWGSPDGKSAWKSLHDLGVDYINTDAPATCYTYLSTLKQRTYTNTFHSPVYTPTYESDQKDTEVKNIILLIGDGNGLSQISAATLANQGALTLTQLKSIGFIKTQSADDFTTDSAAAGTAIATGEKTYNRSIGMDINRKPIENLTEFLYKYDFVTGCITTDEITGATPSSFYAHQIDRDMTDGITADLITSKLNLFIGGGANRFSDTNLDKTFAVVNNLSEIETSTEQKIGHFLSEYGVSSMTEGRGHILAEATKQALTFLNNKNKPFFLMVEGAKIDTYGHFNKIDGIVSEGIDFDTAITEAIKFADTDKNTLVIITADHETSGLSIPQGDVKQQIIEGDFTTFDHTGTMVPIFAYGPQSYKFSGVYENNTIFNKVKEVLKL
ncbi:alkaline phosphatase [Tamlana nanhaiensis]|uniref:Alkaline phosphatase n=2 Tax=Neotamlana nanhaiensis TaxID=1382798 RepID=A0A0D7W0Z0_9FLAO|nr:alkaline phosphatase [Tamlana nanhaiensis]KJD32379.1 alkaline phosphatase [Tamlana nanhaiensis]